MCHRRTLLLIVIVQSLVIGLCSIGSTNAYEPYIPDALSIIGMDGDRAEEHDLTSVEFPFFDVGVEAMEAIVDVIAGRSAQESSRVVPVRLVSRGTVKRVR